jgi:hypothetical protein
LPSYAIACPDYVFRVTYSDDYNFIVRYRPSEVHELAHLEFTTLLAVALVLLTVPPHPPRPPGCRNVGATSTFDGTPNLSLRLSSFLAFELERGMKEADAGVQPTASDSDLPSVVLEVGSSESLAQLKIDARLWLEHTQEVSQFFSCNSLTRPSPGTTGHPYFN